MTKPVFAFFNNKGGVGKTSLVYHLAWMFQDLGYRVIAVDLDPQANLTAAFLEDDRLEELWPDNDHPDTIFGAIQPLLKGIGDIRAPHLEPITSYLNLMVGDLQLSTFEDELSVQWPGCLDRKERSFRVISAFWRMIQGAISSQAADFALIDLGPNLGALNRAALIAADFVIVPLGPDLFSLQGLRNLGPTLQRWQEEWRERLERNPAPDLKLPQGRMQPLGYIVLQHSVRLDRPVKSYNRWMQRVPEVYNKAVLHHVDSSTNQEEYNLAMIKHYHSLMPMAQEARKPIFHLKPADGAIGSHFQAVQEANEDFKKLAKNILTRAKIKTRHAL